MDNIFGLSHLTEKNCINYNSWKYYVFLVHSYIGIVKFNPTNEELCDYRPIYAYVKSVSSEKSMHHSPISEIKNMVTNLN